jgi:mRNA interferase MazF
VVKARSYVPKRGDTVWIDFDPQAGSEQKGRRPALVISPLSYNEKVGLALFCPISNQAKGYPWEVALPPRLAVTGVVLSDQIKSLDWRARRAEFKCKVPERVVVEVLASIQPLLVPE